MKRALFILILAAISGAAFAQENGILFGAGYVFTNIHETDVNANGFRINGTYEFTPMSGKLSHGLTASYVHTTASTIVNSMTIDYKLTHLPVYYSPKLTFGNESFKGYIKAALGLHYSGYIRNSPVSDTDSWDWGFYGGAGVGGLKNLTGNWFLSIEYEWAYLSNSYYNDGSLHSFSAGVGCRF